jgi:predicted DNA-binding antitoxin AbrB/MazE fold protein
MTETVLVVYEEGMLRPLEPLHLKEQQQVYIQIVQEKSKEPEIQDDPIDRLIQRLIREGRMQPRPSGPVPPDPVSEDERLRLAELLGKAPGKPLSEIVIEERGER